MWVRVALCLHVSVDEAIVFIDIIFRVWVDVVLELDMVECLPRVSELPGICEKGTAIKGFSVEHASICGLSVERPDTCEKGTVLQGASLRRRQGLRVMTVGSSPVINLFNMSQGVFGTVRGILFAQSRLEGSPSAVCLSWPGLQSRQSRSARSMMLTLCA